MVIFKKLIAAFAIMFSLGLAANSAQAQEASTWDAIQSRGELRIGVTQAHPSFTKILPPRNGQVWAHQSARPWPNSSV